MIILILLLSGDQRDLLRDDNHRAALDVAESHGRAQTGKPEIDQHITKYTVTHGYKLISVEICFF